MLYNVEMLIGKKVKCQGALVLSDCNIFSYYGNYPDYFDSSVYETFFLTECDGDYSYLRRLNNQLYRIPTAFLINNFSLGD